MQIRETRTPNPGHPSSHSGWGRGFTLIELLLVTVIIGLLASIVSPTFQRARERAIVSQMQSDGRNLMSGLEVYLSLSLDQWPSDLEELSEGGSYVKSEEVEYCMFFAVPPTPWRDGYIIAMIGHPGTTKKLLVVYPVWGNRMLEFDDGRQGC